MASDRKELEFDDLDESKYTFFERALAGAAAGTVEHLSLYPFDTIKTNLQSGSNKSDIFRNLSTQKSTNITYKHNLISLISKVKELRIYGKYYVTKTSWKGVGLNMPAVGFAHALQFPIIEWGSTYTGNSFIGGAIGGIVHDIVMTPANVVKQRMQQCSINERMATCSHKKLEFKNYKSSLKCATSIYQNEGYQIFFRSFPAQTSLTLCYMGTFYYLYNDLGKKITNNYMNINKDKWILDWCIRVLFSTFIATMISQPLDNIVTRVNTQYTSKIPKNNDCNKCIKNIKIQKLNEYTKLSYKTKIFTLSSKNHYKGNDYRNQNNNIIQKNSKIYQSNIYSSRNLSSKSASSPPTSRNINNNTTNINQIKPKITIRSAFKELKSEKSPIQSFWKGGGMRLCLTMPSNFLTWATYESIKSVFDRTSLNP